MSRIRLALLAVPVAATAACGNPAQGSGPAGAFPPLEVEVVALAPKPITRASDFVGVVRSLRSTTIQPQVEGFVTRIFVRSGARVRAGQPLVQIDPDKQQAAVGSLESARVARQAEVAYARQQFERMQTLFKEGLASRLDLDQAETALKTSEAQLAAIEAQIRESRVELQYYRVTAPTAGTIGDIPVRVGDRVSTGTVITTIDQSEGFEAYISVPLEQAAGLRLGLPVELLDADRRVLVANQITFIAPRADDATQTVLVKSRLQNVPAEVRAQQYVRARIVWSRDPALAVPVIAVNRLGGAYFCFVAEPADEGFVARQKPIQVGNIVEQEYVVRGGLESGDRVIVSRIQKLRDGAPVKPQT